MLLKINQIQVLDSLLKKLNSNFLYTSKNETLNLVVKFNNSLWKGDFTLYHQSKLLDYYIDNCNDIECNALSIIDMCYSLKKSKFDRYKNIKFDKIYLVLPELIEEIQKCDLSTIHLNPILYNATNLDSNFKLPFILFNDNDELEVISVVISSKED